jgi:hypothetical protein
MLGVLSSPFIVSLAVACLVGVILFFYFRSRNEQIEHKINSVYDFVKNEALIRNKQHELFLEMTRAQLGGEVQQHQQEEERKLINVSDNEGPMDQIAKSKLVVVKEHYESEEEEDTSDEEEDDDDDKPEIKKVSATIPDKRPSDDEEDQVFRKAPVSRFSPSERETGGIRKRNSPIYDGSDLVRKSINEGRNMVVGQSRTNKSDGESAGESISNLGTSNGNDGEPIDGTGEPVNGDVTKADGDDGGHDKSTIGLDEPTNVLTDDVPPNVDGDHEPTGVYEPNGGNTYQDGNKITDLETASSVSLHIIQNGRNSTQKSHSSVVSNVTDIQTLLGRRLSLTTVKKLTMPILKSLSVHKGIIPDMDVKIKKNDLVELFMKHQKE